MNSLNITAKRVTRVGRRRGFSALETITVLAIGVVVSVIGFSGFKLFNKNLPCKTVTRRLTHALSTARAFAIARNTYYQVSIDLDNRSFWVDETIDPAANPATPPAGQRFTPKVVTPEGIDPRVIVEGVLYGASGSPVTTGVQKVIFRPDGSSTQDARFRFYQIGDDVNFGTSFHTVRVYAPTGASKAYPHQKL